MNKHELLLLREKLVADFHALKPTDSLLALLKNYSSAIDQHLIEVCNNHPWSQKFDFCILATGGYGRGELFPFSDCDLAIITQQVLNQEQAELLEQFIARTWDAGLKIHHTVRTLEEAISQSQHDVGSYSNLLENRFLFGSLSLHEQLTKLLLDNKLFPLKDFMHEKQAEKEHRHQQYTQNQSTIQVAIKTTFTLEPDIKNTPGGLRDFHILQWFTLKKFHSLNLSALYDNHLLSIKELETLNKAFDFLLRVRFTLHELSQRAQDRLSFEIQPAVAKIFLAQQLIDAQESMDVNKQVEALMQAVFTHCHIIALYNDILISLLSRKSHPKSESQTFYVIHDRLFLDDTSSLSHDFSKIMEAFVVFSKNPKIIGFSPELIRALLNIQNELPSPWINSPQIHVQFYQILGSNRVYETLLLMSHYAILGLYIPAFAKITRKMQYDLFHCYTVDAHILFVIRNLEALSNGQRESAVLCTQLMQKMPHPELLYLAALFHDIGKGSPQDHSLVGAKLIREFSSHFHLNNMECELVEWLVHEHLLFSKTAQQLDIQDPEVILHFAKEVGTQIRLDSLYLLTVADIQATNEKLWNNWRSSLLEELYIKTYRILNQEENTTLGKDSLKTPSEEIEKVNHFSWATQTLPVIDIQQHRLKSATVIDIYSRYNDNLFCRIACVLDNLRFTIVEAKLTLTEDEIHCLSSYIVLEHDYSPIIRPDRVLRLRTRLIEQLTTPNLPLPAPSHWKTRDIGILRFPTKVGFEMSKDHSCTMLMLTTRDRPGLLAKMGRIFIKLQLTLKKAVIGTLGERVEDVFYLSQSSKKMGTSFLNDEIQTHLAHEIIEALDNGRES